MQCYLILVRKIIPHVYTNPHYIESFMVEVTAFHGGMCTWRVSQTTDLQLFYSCSWKQCGWPSRIHSDRGRGNVGVATAMPHHLKVVHPLVLLQLLLFKWVWLQQCEFVHGKAVWNTCIIGLHCSDERMHLNIRSCSRVHQLSFSYWCWQPNIGCNYPQAV